MAILLFNHIDSASELEAQPDIHQELFHLHQQLRPAMQDCQAYIKHLGVILDEGAHLIIANSSTDAFVALALFRIHHNTYQHKLCFLEDLVVNEKIRDAGVGSQMLTYLEDYARHHGCHYISLDSGTFRTRAHKFYYMNNYVADCFHFSKPL